MNAKNISYTEVSDIDQMESMGIETVPVLAVDGETMDFICANNWINEYMGD